MEPVRTLAERLREILARYGVSASELSRRMAFNSRNSVFRILNGEVSYEKQHDFIERMRREKALPLTGGEWSDLEEGLEISRIGAERFCINRAMDELVMPRQAQETAIRVARWVDGAEAEESLETCLGRVLAGKHVQMLIVGCCETVLFGALAREIARAHAQDVQITHYIDATGTALVRAIAAIQPVVYAPGYQAYMLEDGAQRSLYNCDMLLAVYEDDGGRSHFVHAVMPDSGTLSCCEYGDEAAFGFLWHLFTKHAQHAKPIKNMFVQPASPLDYLQYTEQYRAIEEDITLYDIKCDVPINFIHPDILLGPVRDGFAAIGFGEAEEREALVRAFYDVQLRRWQNFFGKHKPTHTIFTYESMRRFALTGRQSDHFFAIRPYTREERVQILRGLRAQTADNPYFTVYFFKKDLTPVQEEIGLYEGRGVLLTKSHTDYRLDGEHAEALITQPEFCESFREYYLKRLLTSCVVPAKETLAILDELIALSESAD